MRKFKVGDRIVYRKPKVSDHPGPRAEDVHPSPHGEDYSYVVDKYWVVAEVLDDETIVAVTRRGKKHRLRVDDPNLHKAGPLGKLLKGDRFPAIDTEGSEEKNEAENSAEDRTRPEPGN